MGRKAKQTDNSKVCNWLMEHRWSHIDGDLRYKLPAWIDDAVYAALYTVAGSSGGKLNIRPKLVFKALMLDTISTEVVKKLEFGHEMSDRHAQRLAQVARFALYRIEERVAAEYPVSQPLGLTYPPHPPLKIPPKEVVDLYHSGDIRGYIQKLDEWRKTLDKQGQ